MKRISTATAVANKFGPGKSGFTDGSVVGGVPSTDLQADWFDHIQEELANLVEDQGIALDPNSRVQLLGALKGRILTMRMVYASAVYAKTPGTKLLFGICHGAGGGGGGSSGTSSGQLAVGSGGNSGAAAIFLLNSGFDGALMTIGAAGTPSTPGGSGGNGGASAFGAIYAPGGLGGLASLASSGIAMAVPPDNSAIATGGNLFNRSTGAGGNGFIFNGGVGMSGNGANSMFGSGPLGRQGPGGGGGGGNIGCGGAGALSGSGSGAQSGGIGAAGGIFLLELA